MKNLNLVVIFLILTLVLCSTSDGTAFVQNKQKHTFQSVQYSNSKIGFENKSTFLEDEDDEEFEEDIDSSDYEEIEIEVEVDDDSDSSEYEEVEIEVDDDSDTIEFEEEEVPSTPSVSKQKKESKDTDFFEESEDDEELIEENNLSNNSARYFTIAPHIKPRKNLGQIESSIINEASGLVASRNSEGVLWTHNDSGGEPELYAISNEGYMLATYKINGNQHPAYKSPSIINRDWEDISFGPGPKDETDYLYIADIGDNSAIFGTYFIYRVEEPLVDIDQDSTYAVLYTAETIAYKYEDGHRDAETIFVDPNTGDIYIVSKREDSVGVYYLEYPHSTTEVLTATKVATLPFSSAVAGDISPEGNEIIIKNYLQIFYWTVDEDESIASALRRQPAILPYTPEPQGEGLCWDPETLGYYTVSEEPLKNLQAYLYYYERSEDPVMSVEEDDNDFNNSYEYDPKYNNDGSDYMRYLAFSEGTKNVLDDKMQNILNSEFHLQVLHMGLNSYSVTTYMKSSMFVSLDVYDSNGKLIHEVYYGKVPFGPSNFIFDGSSLIPGMYFVQLRTSSGAWTEKILVW